MLSHETEYVRRAALAACMNGIRGTKLPPAILEYLRSEDSGELRRYFMTRLVRRMSGLHDLVARDGRSPGLYRDYSVPVTKGMAGALADQYINPKHTIDVELDELERQLPQNAKAGTKAAEDYIDRQRATKKVKLLFEDFLKIGVPFKLAWTAPSRAPAASLRSSAAPLTAPHPNV
jgi:hypothetical protein